MIEDAVVTWIELSGPSPRQRSLDERFMARFPGAARRLTALGARLFSPGSRLRRAFLRRAVRSGWATAGRGDWDVMLARYAPHVVWEVPREFQALGFAELYRGHDGMREALAQFAEAFESWEVRPACILDLGDRLLTLGSFHGRGRTSGVEWKQQFAQFVTLASGAVAREQGFYAWEEGLRAAGLDPDVVTALRLQSP